MPRSGTAEVWRLAWRHWRRDHSCRGSARRTFATLPVALLTETGVTLAVSVLLDTIIVRPVLVTALTLDAGRWKRWPSARARRSPYQTARTLMPCRPRMPRPETSSR